MFKIVTRKIIDILEVLPIKEKLSVEKLTSGVIPVYSSETQNKGVKGYCDKPQFKIDKDDYKRKQYIVFGDHTRSVNIIDTDFNVMDNIKVLIPKYDKIDLTYIKYVWKDKIPNLGYSRHWKIAKHIEIEIPVDENGCFYLEKQKELAQKYKDIEEKKGILLEKIEVLKKHKVIFNTKNTGEYVNIKLNEAVVHHNGKAMYTKEWCQNHQGEIPLYSANNSRPIATMDRADYNGKFLTYSKNGCAGYITILNGRFSVNGDRCVITLNKEYKNIDLLYLKYYLEPIFRANIKGRVGINGKNEYTKLNSTMIKKLNIQVPIPIKANGEYDLEKQQELAQKYATIESIKQNLYNQIQELISTTVI